MAEVAPAVLKSLNRLRCSIFQTTFNPISRRNGAKYLKSRLRGPSMVEYYPPRDEMSITKLNTIYPGWNLVDIHEVRRKIAVQEHKDRGKGAPKKAKTKGTNGPFYLHWNQNTENFIQPTLVVLKRSDSTCNVDFWIFNRTHLSTKYSRLIPKQGRGLFLRIYI